MLSKRIVQITPAGGTLVLENLREIRSRGERRGKASRRRFHSWSFRQLASFISYKAEQQGVRVERVDPRHTSQRCPRCGHTAKNNRRSQALFSCRKCRYTLNADLVGSYNIRDKYLASLDILLTDGLSSSSLSSQPSG